MITISASSVSINLDIPSRVQPSQGHEKGLILHHERSVRDNINKPVLGLDWAAIRSDTCSGIFRGSMEHVHNIATMAMLDDIVTTPCMWMSSFMPGTFVHLMISILTKHLQGSEMTQGPIDPRNPFMWLSLGTLSKVANKYGWVLMVSTVC